MAPSAAALSERERRAYRFFRIQTFALTWTAYASYYLCRKNLSVTKKALQDVEGLSNVELGDIDTGFLVAYAIGQFFSGYIGDRVGAKPLVGFGLIITALLNIFFGLGETPTLFLLLWTLNGAAQSSGWPGCAKAFSNWYATGERGTVMGVWCTCYQVGGVVSTLVATWFTVTFGWRSAFFGPALLVAGFAVLFWAFQKRAPEKEGLPSAEEYYSQITGKSAPGTEDEPATSSEEPGGLASVLFVLRSRPIWTLALTYVVLKFIRYSLLFWLPFYMSVQLGYGEGEAGYTSVVFDLAGAGGAIAAGLLSDRVFRGRRAPVVVVMMVMLGVSTYLYSAFGAAGRIENIIGIALIGFFLFGPDTVTSGVAAVDFGDRRSAALATGFVNGLGSFGGALSGVVVGRVSQAYGWEAVFNLFGPLSFLGAAMMATMWNRRGGKASGG